MTRATDPADPGAKRGDRAAPGLETMSFGPGAPIKEATVIPNSAPDVGVEPHPVDAWYEEPVPEPKQEPTWLTRLWLRWREFDRDRRVIIVLAGISAVALVATVLGLATRGSETPVQLPTVQSHGLDVHAAACFAYGRVERRLAAELGAAGLAESSEDLGRVPMTEEIDALDGLAAEYPEADYRLIVAFADVADTSVRLLNAEQGFEFEEARNDRLQALDAAQSACAEISGFDVAKLQPGD